MTHIAFGGHAETTPAAHATHVLLAHQTGNAFAAGVNACVLQLGANARHAIGCIAGDKRCTNLRRQHDVGLLARAHRTLQPAIEAAGRNLECFAQGAHGKFGLIGCNQVVAGVNVLSLLWANQAVAFARMSRSICTCRNLRRRSMSSWRSLAFNARASPEPMPLAASAWRTQFRCCWRGSQTPWPVHWVCHRHEPVLSSALEIAPDKAAWGYALCSFLTPSVRTIRCP